MDGTGLTRSTYSFSLRIWPEEVAPGQVEWRGRLQHLQSGEVRHVRGLEALVAVLGELLVLSGRGERTETDTEEER